MALTRATLTELVARIVADIDAKFTGATSALRRSVRYVLATVFAGVAHLMYGWLEYNKEQAFVTQAAVDDGLPEQAALYGVVRKAATAAEGDILVTGTYGATISSGTKMYREDDRREYKTTAAYTVNGPSPVGSSAATKVISVTAIVAGSDANENAGTTLLFKTVPTGVNATGVVQSGGITGGTDIEVAADWRARILARKQKPAHGGADFDYVAWMLENSNVTRAWCVPNYLSISGAVGCAFVNDDESSGKIIPSEAVLATMEEYLIEHTDPSTGDTVGIPLGAREALTMIQLEASSQDYTIAVSPYNDDVIDRIKDEIEAFYRREAGPGETLSLSRLSEAISVAKGEFKHKIVLPTSDPVSESTELPTVGTITFQGY